jgi:hypothetical protein
MPATAKRTAKVCQQQHHHARSAMTVSANAGPNGLYLDSQTIDAISAWIDAGANQ